MLKLSSRMLRCDGADIQIANHNRIAGFRVWLPALTGVVMLLTGNSALVADDALDDWLFSDWEQQAAGVNEGRLHIFDKPLDEAVHVHSNRMAIAPDSLRDGWVDLWQCHHNLDAVPALEIVFRSDRTRQLRVIESHHIGSVQVEGDSVQLQDVAPGSRLCLQLQTRALHVDGNLVELVTGPYMRRFLDGFYPMRVQLEVSYPPQLLRLVGKSPQLFEPAGEGKVKLDLWFEGRLHTRLRFARKQQPPQHD